MFAVRPCQTHSMRTRDGVRLDADVYWPDGEGPFPVLLMRQPYGRAIASTIVYAHPRWYAAHGYIVVIQDVRGRGTSAGKFCLFEHEVEDGADTLRWAAQLPRCDGQVGMYGFSYQGMTQLYAAEGAAQEGITGLKAIAPAMTGYHPYEDWAYENGALCLQLGLTWAIQLAAETARIAGEMPAYQQLLAAARNLPVSDTVAARPEVLKAAESFFHDWVENPESNNYWQGITPQLQAVDLPMLHVGGWFDPYLRGDLRLYQEMVGRSAYPQPLCVGPWVHIPWGRKVGEVDFGSAAMSSVDEMQIRWFDRILKGEALPDDWSNVRLFEMGRNEWRYWDDWPKTSLKSYFLQSDGLANIREDSGALADEAGAAVGCDAVGYDCVVHDPWNPAPSLGGHSSIPGGVFERSHVDIRGDVLTYTSDSLTDELCVVGVVEVVGAIASNTPSYDVCAVLSRVQGGEVHNITQGYRRIEGVVPGEMTPMSVALHPSCFSLAPGEALRLSLSAACFPAYPVNTGRGEPPSQERRIAAQIITLAIAIGGLQGMRIDLPIQQPSVV